RPLAVLVVEDNAETADSLALFLRYSGYEVRIAHDAAAAVHSARVRPPDAVLCDIRLPDADGYAVASQVRALLGRGPLLVAVTGYPDGEFRNRARAAGFDHALTKPIDPFELDKLIQAHASRLDGGNGTAKPGT